MECHGFQLPLSLVCRVCVNHASFCVSLECVLCGVVVLAAILASAEASVSAGLGLAALEWLRSSSDNLLALLEPVLPFHNIGEKIFIAKFIGKLFSLIAIVNRSGPIIIIQRKQFLVPGGIY